MVGRLVGGRREWNAIGFAAADPSMLEVVGEGDGQMHKDAHVHACAGCAAHVKNVLEVAQNANPGAVEFKLSPQKQKQRRRGTHTDFTDLALMRSPQLKRLKAVASGLQEGSMRHLPFPAPPEVRTTFKVLWFCFISDAVTG